MRKIQSLKSPDAQQLAAALSTGNTFFTNDKWLNTVTEIKAILAYDLV